MCVAVVVFLEVQLTVKSTAYDRNFGGRDIELLHLIHFNGSRISVSTLLIIPRYSIRFA